MVVAADTVVVLDNSTVLEKPKDAEDAKRMLRALSNRKNTVMTCTVLASATTHPNDSSFHPFKGVELARVCQDGVQLLYHIVKTDVHFGLIDDDLLEACKL